MSERFLFMPSIGWALGGAWCISLLHKNKSPGIAGSWTLASIILFVITFAFSMLVIRRNPVWKDNFSLFTTDVKTSSQSAKLLNAAGGETLAQITKIQDTSLQRQYALQAEDYLTKALEIHPVYKNAWLLLGNSKFYQKQYDAAIENYNNSLKLDPKYPDALKNKILALREGGRYYGEIQNNLPKALDYLTQAYLMDPKDFGTLRYLGIGSALSGKTQEALKYFQEALAVTPDDAEIHFYIGNVYRQLGNAAEGKKWHDKAAQLNPKILEQISQSPQ